MASDGEHHPPLALEFLESVHLGIGFGDATGRKSSAVAAVEHENILSRRAGIHGIVDLLSRQGSEEKVIACGVRHGQIQPTLVVFQAMPSEVQQREILTAPIAIELANGPAHDVMRLVNQDGDIKVGDLRVAKDLRQRLRVVTRSGQLAQPGVLVAVGGYQQRQPLRHGYSTS